MIGQCSIIGKKNNLESTSQKNVRKIIEEMDDIFGLNPCPKNQATFNWCLVGVSIHSAWVWRSFTYCFIITRYFGRCLKAFDAVFSTEQSCLWAGSSLHFTVTLLLLCEIFYDSYVQISTPSDNILSHAWTKIGQLLQCKLKSNLILIICFLYIIRECLKTETTTKVISLFD